MKLLYGEDKYFVGIVKFYDNERNFGFIASNNCNMTSTTYKQDFYVNSKHILDEAKKDECTVVFQIEILASGKTRAVNVRCITKSDEDMKLLITYYGEHEWVELNDNKKFNLYTSVSKPRRLVLEHIRSIIENDKERSPQTTASHFRTYVKHHKEGFSLNEKYIFDKDYSTELESAWQSLFDVFTDEECFEIIKEYPTTYRYIQNKEIIKKWINFVLKNEYATQNWEPFDGRYNHRNPKKISTIKKLYKIKDLIDTFPEDFISLERNLLNEIADKWIKQILNYFSNTSSTGLSDVLKFYLHLTTKNYDDEIKQCKENMRHYDFVSTISDLKIYKHHNLTTYHSVTPHVFHEINNYCKNNEQYIQEVKDILPSIIDNFISKKEYLEAVETLNYLNFLDDDFILKNTVKLHSSIKKYLIEESQSYINKKNSNYLYFTEFRDLTRLFKQEEIDDLMQSIIPIIFKSNDLRLLSDFSNEGFIPIERALEKAKDIIKSTPIEDLEKIVQEEQLFFRRDPRFTDIILGVFLPIFSEEELNKYLEKKDVNDPFYFPTDNYANTICQILKALKRYIPDKEKNEQWENYINTRSIEDYLILYNNKIIAIHPQNILEKVINSLSPDSVSSRNNRWYWKPELKDYLKKYFEYKYLDLMTPITKRLISMDITNDNIPLAVLLVELLKYNDPSIYTLCKSEEDFRSYIKNLKYTQQSNKRLSVILWAVYFETSTSMDTLTDMFPYLPPYIQIRCVKKLFQLISQGKITHTAKSLYELLTKAGKPICFPLEITFKYLILREENPKATLDNNIMLHLLEGREDHMEWIEIKQMMTGCPGRWTTKDLSNYHSNPKRNNYYNGIIKFNNNKIEVIVHEDKVDLQGEIQYSSNTDFGNIIELIEKTYTPDEYERQESYNKVKYIFDASHELDLYAIARAFNLAYGYYNNELSFVKAENLNIDFCECRMANEKDERFKLSFFWCNNKPCFRAPIRYMLDNEWERYTILDFMRILHLPVDYTNEKGKQTKFGHYIILSSYLRSFTEFYEHLKCRECGRLMKATDLSNFAYTSVTQFQCVNEQCKNKGQTVYLNHCFNKPKCNTTIDSRDSKTCPNGQYICPECGACCSTENFKQRINNLKKTGGFISNRIIEFVRQDLGHWEKGVFFCYKCGMPLNGSAECKNCNVEYKKLNWN